MTPSQEVLPTQVSNTIMSRVLLHNLCVCVYSMLHFILCTGGVYDITQICCCNVHLVFFFLLMSLVTLYICEVISRRILQYVHLWSCAFSKYNWELKRRQLWKYVAKNNFRNKIFMYTCSRFSLLKVSMFVGEHFHRPYLIPTYWELFYLFTNLLLSGNNNSRFPIFNICRRTTQWNCGCKVSIGYEWM